MKKRSQIYPSVEDTEDEGDVLRKFGKFTNIEGINNAGRAEERTRLVLWLTIFVFLVALTVYDLTQLVQDYLSYPVDVSTTLEHQNAIDRWRYQVYGIKKIFTAVAASLAQGE